MSWKNALNQLSHALRTPDADPAPLHARINGLIRYQSAPILKAQGAGSIMDAPPEGDQIIRAISHLKGDFGDGLWRLHTQIGDPLTDDNRFVQVFLRPDDSIEEAVLYSRLYGFVPEVSDLPDYDGTSGRGLGDVTWQLSRAELQSIGLSDSELNAIGNPEQIVYERDTPSRTGVMLPYRARESRVGDGCPASFADVTFMLYHRVLNDATREILMIQRTIERDAAGAASRVYVMAWVGIPIEPQRLAII